MSEKEHSANLAGSESHKADDVDILEILIAISRYKRRLIIAPLVAAIAGFLTSFLIPPWYTATAKVMPPAQSSSASSMMLSQLGGLAGLAGSSLGVKSPSDTYVAMLQSQTIADALISRFNLRNEYKRLFFFERSVVGTREKLDDNSDIYAGTTDGVIVISAQSRSPELAADIANGYVDELQKLSNTLFVGEAINRESMFSKQLADARKKLDVADSELKTLQERSGVVKIDDQATAILQRVAELRAQVTLKEIQLASTRSFATEQNPDFVRIANEVVALRRELDRAESESNPRKTGDIFVPTAQLPSVGAAYIKKLRDVKYYEQLVALLGQQYELARVDALREIPLIQVLDRATAPDQQSFPKRGVLATFFGVLGFLAALVTAMASYAFSTYPKESQRAKRLALLRTYITRW